MPVDFMIHGPNSEVYLEKKNIVYGKFAFVLPEGKENSKVFDAEFHRKKREKKGGKGKGGGRRLLSKEDEHHGDKAVGQYDDLEEEHWNDWDYDEYEGIDEEGLHEEVEKHKRRHHADKGHERYGGRDEGEDKVETRTFNMCFMHLGEKEKYVKRRVSFAIDIGRSAKDYTRMAKKNHLSKLETSLRQASDELSELLVELDEVRSQEEMLADVIEGTHASLNRYAVMGLIAMFIVGGCQAYYTRTYLRKKKVM